MEISDPGSPWGRDRDPNLRKRKWKEVKSSVLEEKTGPLPSPQNCGKEGTASPMER